MIPPLGCDDMPGIDQQRPAFQFGAFELDRRTGELRKYGVNLKLQDQPLQILLLLLERPGEVVTREEIQKRLWPDHTYVDFDNAINSAIRKLRDALGDSPNTPRFIETLARRGYRFIYPVSPTHGSVERDLPRVSAGLPTVAKERRSWRTVAAVVAVFGLAGIGVRFWIANSRSGRTEPPTAPVPLTTYPGIQLFPSFSPDGTRVAFSEDEPGKRPSNIYVKMVGPGDPVRLTKNPNGDFAPAWSLDGRSIAFLRAVDYVHASIIVMPALGGQERELARIRFDAGTFLGHWSWTVPPPFLAWSADGKWLLGLEQDTPAADQAAPISKPIA
jgi:DNA-binding winged helix-turn-helix (wHTH) protein